MSSVSRELRRNCTRMYDTPSYYPHTAQKKSNLQRSYCHRGMFWSQELIKYIEEKRYKSEKRGDAKMSIASRFYVQLEAILI